LNAFGKDSVIQNEATTPRYGLVLDTSSPVLTLGIGTQEGPFRCGTWQLDREISAQLHPLLQAFLAPQEWTDLAWIAVMKGPGSFTGTRIGVVTARMLAQHLNIPLFGFSNLAVTAWMEAVQRDIHEPWTVALTLPGQLGFVYGAIYEVNRRVGTLAVATADQLVTVKEWRQVLAERPQLDEIESPPLMSKSTLPSENIGDTLLTLGWQSWQQGQRSEWQETLPYYG
jgi:tRNA threonylcarbamoyl adenosine modification protein YeaZ